MQLACKVALVLRLLSTELQDDSLDLVSAYVNIRAARNTIHDSVNQAGFEEVLKETQDICEALGIEEKLRPSESRTGRSVQQFLQDEIFFPYMHSLVAEIDARFGGQQAAIFSFQKLLPRRVKDVDRDQILTAARLYKFHLSEEEADIATLLLEEITRWQSLWATTEEKPATLSETLMWFNKTRSRRFFKCIYILLQILGTTPVGTASAERSFSRLKRIYSDFRSTMGEERLSDMSIAACYRVECSKLKADDLVEKFAKKGSRRIQLK